MPDICENISSCPEDVIGLIGESLHNVEILWASLITRLGGVEALRTFERFTGGVEVTETIAAGLIGIIAGKYIDVATKNDRGSGPIFGMIATAAIDTIWQLTR